MGHAICNCTQIKHNRCKEYVLLIQLAIFNKCHFVRRIYLLVCVWCLYMSWSWHSLYRVLIINNKSVLFAFIWPHANIYLVVAYSWAYKLTLSPETVICGWWVAPPGVNTAYCKVYYYNLNIENRSYIWLQSIGFLIRVWRAARKAQTAMSYILHSDCNSITWFAITMTWILRHYLLFIFKSCSGSASRSVDLRVCYLHNHNFLFLNRMSFTRKNNGILPASVDLFIDTLFEI